MVVAIIGKDACRGEGQHGSQALASRIDKMTGEFGNHAHRRIEPAQDFPVHRLKIVIGECAQAIDRRQEFRRAFRGDGFACCRSQSQNVAFQLLATGSQIGRWGCAGQALAAAAFLRPLHLVLFGDRESAAFQDALKSLAFYPTSTRCQTFLLFSKIFG